MKKYRIGYINKRKDGRLHRIISKELKLSEIRPYLLSKKNLLQAQIFEFILSRGLVRIADVNLHHELQFYSIFDGHFYACPMTSTNFYPLLKKASYIIKNINNH